MEIRRMQNRSEEGSFMSYTRQSSDFVFPTINDKINGEKRPRPNQFKLKDIDVDKLHEGKTEEFKESLKDEETITGAELYKKTLQKAAHKNFNSNNPPTINQESTKNEPTFHQESTNNPPKHEQLNTISFHPSRE
jgi:hypothetical protein